MFRDMPG